MVSTISATDLYITGNVTAGGTIQANYSDLAEYFLASEFIATGEPTSIIGLRRVGKYNGRAYAGIRSTEPALTMGGELTEGIAIALAGSVPVSTSDTSIRLGDTLILLRTGKIVRKRWYHFGVPRVGIAQEDYKDSKVVCLVGV